MIKYKKGNIITEFEYGDYQLLLHGCNCFHTMGSGVAKALKDNYPEVYEVDKQTAYGDYNKLGTISSTIVLQKVITDGKRGPYIMSTTPSAQDIENKYVINCYTQHHYGKDAVYLNYPALEMCFDKVIFMFPFHHKIIMGKIGCVRAGGDWNIVSKIIDRYFKDVTVCEL